MSKVEKTSKVTKVNTSFTGKQIEMTENSSITSRFIGQIPDTLFLTNQKENLNLVERIRTESFRISSDALLNRNIRCYEN